METLVVNMFGGPGCGKSSVAALVFSCLKGLNINCELVGEFAKECVWEERMKVLDCQPYVFGVQLWRMERLVKAKVPVILCDSPLLLSAVYCDFNRYPKEFLSSMLEIHYLFNNLNFFLERKKKFTPNGRRHNENEAKKIDRELMEFLNEYCVGYFNVDGNDQGSVEIIEKILKMINWSEAY